ncbi:MULTISPECIES: hypothetical protein [unclassified Saccharicrinis]|uniref:hypothetical protein n=1 Tax=unclassified Saccharicrinis TaxID=2646859 RepID=UPI003D34D200
MRKVRELLRLHFTQGQSARQGAKIVGIGKTSASEYISGFKNSGLDYTCVEKLSDTDLLQAINVQKETGNTRYKALYGQFVYFEKELNRTGVTLQLLWQEYKNTHAESYAYSQFCHHFYKWRNDQKVSMPMEHKAGDELFVDYTGKKLSYTDVET